MKDRYLEIQQKLLEWYDENRRDLPWRFSTHPYAVWVSEIMAQQTKIAALLPYYERFMALFPTVFALALAEEDQVLKAWEGLGYYSRARNLHRAAQKVVSQHGGVLPNTKKELLALPGIGDYTAGAILSIAYGKPEAAVDGNVLRVFSRVENCHEDVGLSKTRTRAEEFVAELMPKDRTGCFTQALMELGALVCIPKNPACETCPLNGLCYAKRQELQRSLPVKAVKKPPKETAKTVLLLVAPDGRIALRQRSERLLCGLWEFYMVEGFLDQEAILHRLKGAGCAVSEITPIGKAKHVFTHMVWNMEGYYVNLQEQKKPEGFLLFTSDEIKELALPTAIRAFSNYIFERSTSSS